MHNADKLLFRKNETITVYLMFKKSGNGLPCGMKKVFGKPENLPKLFSIIYYLKVVDKLPEI